MSEPNATAALALLDDLLKLAAGSVAATIEVESGDLAVALVRNVPPPVAAPSVAGPAPASAAEKVPHRVLATSVGIFRAAKEWAVGDAVTTGLSLGAIQSLGHMAEIAVPVDGLLTSVLVAGGAPVEYGQPLFAITATP